VTAQLWSQIEDQALDIICKTIDKKLVDPDPAPGECNWCDYKNVCKSPRVQQRLTWVRVKEPDAE